MIYEIEDYYMFVKINNASQPYNVMAKILNVTFNSEDDFYLMIDVPQSAEFSPVLFSEYQDGTQCIFNLVDSVNAIKYERFDLDNNSDVSAYLYLCETIQRLIGESDRSLGIRFPRWFGSGLKFTNFIDYPYSLYFNAKVPMAFFD